MALLTNKQVLNKLTIKDRHVVGYLVERGLLPHIKMGERTYRYEESDVDRLIELSKREGLSLTSKPIKKAA